MMIRGTTNNLYFETVNLSKIIKWADKEESIRALILTGSLASKEKTDHLSDYDIALFCSDLSLLTYDEWLNKIQKYLVCIHDKYVFLEYEIATRLTIFDIKFKADFSFHPLDILEKLASSKMLPDSYNIGCRVLIDKDNSLSKMQKPEFKGFIVEKPAEKEFQNNMNEFWFEVYHEGKYLFRDDLWTAKYRDHAVKEKLLQMLEWNHSSKSDWKFSLKNYGKKMEDWIDINIWNDIHHCYENLKRPTQFLL